MYCVSQEIMNQVDPNYQKAQREYTVKREKIIQRLNEVSNQSSGEFLQKFQENYRALLDTKYKSELTGRSVKIDTIIRHLYKAAQSVVQNLIDQNDLSALEAEVNSLKAEQADSDMQITQIETILSQAIQNYFEKYALQSQIDELVSKYLPTLSSDNAELTSQQLYGYTRSLLKQHIIEKTNFAQIETVVRKMPAQILGYVREDMVADAALKVIEQLKLKASARSTGAHNTSIDILISLGGANASPDFSNKEVFKELLTNLDKINGEYVAAGESKYKTENLLGIQSKPWDLSKPATQWRRFSVGSRAPLFSEFSNGRKSMEADVDHGWHKGVLFLSSRIPQILGENTVMYVVGGKIVWTDDLIKDLYSVYHKYFAFAVTQDNKLSSKVVLADHYG